MSFYNLTILLVSFSLINAATLDGACEGKAQCSGPGLICSNNKCQCERPWFKPCQGSCDPNLHVSYEGEECKAIQNCVPNTVCIDGRCKCAQGLQARNGACFKPLDTSCQNANECWSNYCYQSRCRCPPGTNAINSIICERKLLNAYENWAQANAKQEFCLDHNSCLDISATCETDPAHPQNKFCKCPTDSEVKNGKCDRIKGEHLSPLDITPANYGKCGRCEDTNAVCTEAAGRKTCWCRSGYKKNGDKCQKHHDKQALIFPNEGDIKEHKLDKDCDWESSNDLCVCPSGYRFDGTIRSCVKIIPDWENDAFEYGVCTQINSNDRSIGQQKLCPAPLKCIAKDDKHVCSCGLDQFLNLENASQCVYYIDKGATDPNAACPKNARKIAVDKNCECLLGYNKINKDRQCELKLSEESYTSECNSTAAPSKVCETFGDKARFCKTGECRCLNNETVPNVERTYCYAKLNTTLSTPYAPCPPNANHSGTRCLCNPGFKASNDLRICEKKNLKLVLHQNDTVPPNGLHTTKDCQALFSGSVEFYTNDECRCTTNAFINDAGDGCWFKINVTVSDPKTESACTPNSTLQSDKCQCKIGYRNNGQNRCVPIQQLVYYEDDIRVANVTNVTPGVCVVLFGLASEKSSKGNYCVCRKTVAFPLDDNTYCQFFINASTSDPKGSRTCPDNSEPSGNGSLSKCVCKPGYQVSSDNRLCQEISIPLIGFEVNPIANGSNCIKISTIECENLYGKHAFCFNEQCYCDKHYHYLTKDGRCGKLEGVFPGEHELDIYSCRTTNDCSEKEFVVCDYWHGNKDFKVCQCESGTYLDLDTQTCVDNRCSDCDSKPNSECRNHKCQCKSGYFLSGDQCVKTIELKLHNTCIEADNLQIGENSSTTCDVTCSRVICRPNYKIKGSTCVKNELSSDKCLHKNDICTLIDSNTFCNRNENKCRCKSGFYQSNNQCETSVGFPCTTDDDCDNGMQCKGRQCACQEGQHTKKVKDGFGRPIERCERPSTGGAKQNSRNLILVFFVCFISFYFFF